MPNLPFRGDKLRRSNTGTNKTLTKKSSKKSNKNPFANRPPKVYSEDSQSKTGSQNTSKRHSILDNFVN
jgi:hypothetical protein